MSGKKRASESEGWIGEPYKTEVEIVENGVHYLVDVENGQKTGFFLDQKYNRLAMQRICKGKRVLDCFTHMGTFALNAGIAGATEVTGLDISDYAVSQATENAKRNGLEDRVTFRCANVFDELPRLAEAGEKYDVVILDPPAFTKSRQATKNCHQRLSRDQYQGTETGQRRRLPCHLLLFPFYDPGTPCENGSGSCKKRS